MPPPVSFSLRNADADADDAGRADGGGGGGGVVGLDRRPDGQTAVRTRRQFRGQPLPACRRPSGDTSGAAAAASERHSVCLSAASLAA